MFTRRSRTFSAPALTPRQQRPAAVDEIGLAGYRPSRVTQRWFSTSSARPSCPSPRMPASRITEVKEEAPSRRRGTWSDPACRRPWTRQRGSTQVNEQPPTTPDQARGDNGAGVTSLVPGVAAVGMKHLQRKSCQPPSNRAKRRCSHSGSEHLSHCQIHWRTSLRGASDASIAERALRTRSSPEP